MRTKQEEIDLVWKQKKLQASMARNILKRKVGNACLDLAERVDAANQLGWRVDPISEGCVEITTTTRFTTFRIYAP